MVILTAVIALSTVVQAVFIRGQWVVLRRAEALRTTVRLFISPYSSMGCYGFSVVNASLFAITITGWKLEEEMPAASRWTGTGGISIPTTPAHDLSTPRRLESGEPATVALRRDLAPGILTRKDGTSIRFRLVVLDALGNVHRSSWMSWRRDCMMVHNGPAPGYIPQKA